MKKLLIILSLLVIAFNVAISQNVGKLKYTCEMEDPEYWVTKGAWNSGYHDCLISIDLTQGVGEYMFHKVPAFDNGTWQITSLTGGYYSTRMTGADDRETFTIYSSPVVTSDDVSSVTDIGALSGGNVTSDNYSTVSARGVCWSTSESPTIADSHTTDGSGTGSFSSTVTGLYANTTYYLRAYATNSAGTSYGDQKTFTTGVAGAGNCLDFDGSDDFVDIGAGPGSIKTIEFWVYPETTSEHIIDLNGSAYISTAGGTLSATNFTTPTIRVNGIEGSTIEANSWQHISITTPTAVNASDIDIGRLELTDSFLGKIDELRLWSDERTVSEIISNMCITLMGNEANLEAYYRMNHSSGTALTDLSSNGFDGTLQNMDDSDWQTSSAFTIWDGETDSDWNDTGNWTDGIPGSSDNAGVLAVSNQPSISSSISSNNMVICEGTTLTFNYAGSHTIHGNVYNIGTTNLEPSTDLTITGSLYMLHTSVLNVKPLAYLTVEKKLYTSIWGLTGTLTLVSNSNGTGSLIVDESTTGNVVVQRYVGGHNNVSASGWHFLSSPVINQNISPDFVNVASSPITTALDFYRWEESEGLWVNIKNDDGNYNQGSTSLHFSNESNPTFDGGKGYLIAYQSDQTFSFEGNLLSGNIGISGLTNTNGMDYQGWHLLGNPTTSALDFNSGSWNKSSSIAEYAQIWNESASSYKVLRGEQIIPSGNGFMVYTSENGGSLTIPLDAQVHSDSSWYKNEENKEIVLSVVDINEGVSQETVILFNENATPEFDIREDSYFIAGFAPMLFSIVNDKFLALNSLPENNLNNTVPLGFVKNKSEEFILKLNGNTSDFIIYLKDNLLNKQHNLSADPEYSFTSINNDEINRFDLIISAVDISENHSPEVIGVVVHGSKLEVLNPNCEKGFIYLYDLSGRCITKTQLHEEKTINEIDINGYSGILIVTIVTDKHQYSSKFIIQ